MHEEQIVAIDEWIDEQDEKISRPERAVASSVTRSSGVAALAMSCFQ
jgi:hypothetical protein